MNLLEKICEELGVEVGEEWDSIDGNRYCILIDGLIEVNGDSSGYNYWKDIFKGLVKPIWNPEMREYYYVPYLDDIDKGKCYQRRVWNDTNYGRTMLKHNLVFKTKEEAIEAANKMLNVLRDE